MQVVCGHCCFFSTVRSHEHTCPTSPSASFFSLACLSISNSLIPPSVPFLLSIPPTSSTLWLFQRSYCFPLFPGSDGQLMSWWECEWWESFVPKRHLKYEMTYDNLFVFSRICDGCLACLSATAARFRRFNRAARLHFRVIKWTHRKVVKCQCK